MGDDKSRTVVVTGGSRGIGRAICCALGGPGSHLYFNYSSAVDAAAETEKAVLGMGGSVKSARVDVSDAKEVAEYFKKIVSETGRIDILVNNAGITRDGLLVRMKDSDWNAVIDTNLKGAFNCTKIAARSMMKQRYGRIINITSVVGVTGNPGQANYVASKAGLIGFTKAVAKELASRNITVNAVAPGYIETDMTEGLPDSAKDEIVNQVPLGRSGKPEEVAGVVAFLASDTAAYLTGQVIHVSGGMYI